MRLLLRGLLDRLAQGCGRGEVWGVVLEGRNPVSKNPDMGHPVGSFSSWTRWPPTRSGSQSTHIRLRNGKNLANISVLIFSQRVYRQFRATCPGPPEDLTYNLLP